MGDKVGWPLGTILAHSYYTDGVPAAELDLLAGCGCLLGVARHCSRVAATGYDKHVDEIAVGTTLVERMFPYVVCLFKSAHYIKLVVMKIRRQNKSLLLSHPLWFSP